MVFDEIYIRSFQEKTFLKADKIEIKQLITALKIEKPEYLPKYDIITLLDLK